jgi:multisubunit Na+/H+ antiporter MnhF subunit
MTAATFVVLVVAAGLFMLRMLRGPTLADRVNALNGLLVVGVSAIAAHAVETAQGAFIPAIVVLTLVGFVGTAMVARFIEGRGR